LSEGGTVTVHTPHGTGIEEAEALRRPALTPVDEEHRFDLGEGIRPLLLGGTGRGRRDRAPVLD